MPGRPHERKKPRRRRAGQAAARPESRRKARGLLHVALSMPRPARPALRRRGFLRMRLVSEWPAIVGETVAGGTAPLKLVFAGAKGRNGLLHLRVASGLAPLLVHEAPRIVERINAYFGYGAVAGLRLQQGPVPARRRPRPAPPPPLGAAEAARIEKLVAPIRHPALRDSLRRLGAAVRGAAGT